MVFLGGWESLFPAILSHSPCWDEAGSTPSRLGDGRGAGDLGQQIQSLQGIFGVDFHSIL